MASRSNLRAIALSPPAVFSIRIGSGKPPSAWPFKCLAPVVDSDLRVVLGADVAAVHDETFGTDACRRLGMLLQILRLGMRILLLVDATLTRYGAWM